MSRTTLGTIVVARARPLVIPFMPALAAAVVVAEEPFGLVRRNVRVHDAALLSPAGGLASPRLLLTTACRRCRLGPIFLADLAADDFAIKREGL